MTPSPTVVAMGERRYAVERRWAELPNGERLEAISQLAVDRRGRVYVNRRKDPPILVFEPSGKLQGAWGEGRVTDAHGIFITADDRVFLVDRDRHQILVFSLDGALLATLGERDRPRFQAPFNHPTDVAVAPDGEIYVSDGYGNSAVHRFSADYRHIRTWGSPGKGPGQFTTPHGVWVDRSNRVLVVDRENDRVQIFDRDGDYLGEWGDFHKPMDLYEDERGMVFVTDHIPRLSMMSPEGALLGRCRPTFNLPHGIAGNADGDLFVAEMNPPSIVKLARIT